MGSIVTNKYFYFQYFCIYTEDTVHFDCRTFTGNWVFLWWLYTPTCRHSDNHRCILVLHRFRQSRLHCGKKKKSSNSLKKKLGEEFSESSLAINLRTFAVLSKQTLLCCYYGLALHPILRYWYYWFHAWLLVFKNKAKKNVKKHH